MNKYVDSRQLTTWVWVNAPVHSTASWKKRKMWSLLTKLSLITSWGCTNIFILRNLPTESAMVHSTVSGERRKQLWLLSMKLSLITQNSILMYKQSCPFKCNLPPEYGLMHQFTVQQVGKRGKCDRYQPSYPSSHKTQSWGCTNMFILRNLPTETSTVHSIASGEKM